MQRDTYEGMLVDRKARGDVLTKANIWGWDAFRCRDEAAAIDLGKWGISELHAGRFGRRRRTKGHCNDLMRNGEDLEAGGGFGFFSWLFGGSPVARRL